MEWKFDGCYQNQAKLIKLLAIVLLTNACKQKVPRYEPAFLGYVSATAKNKIATNSTQLSKTSIDKPPEWHQLLLDRLHGYYEHYKEADDNIIGMLDDINTYKDLSKTVTKKEETNEVIFLDNLGEMNQDSESDFSKLIANNKAIKQITVKKLPSILCVICPKEGFAAQPKLTGVESITIKSDIESDHSNETSFTLKAFLLSSYSPVLANTTNSSSQTEYHHKFNQVVCLAKVDGHWYYYHKGKKVKISAQASKSLVSRATTFFYKKNQ